MNNLIKSELKYKKDIWLGDKVEIGENCKIQAQVFIPDGVKIGNNVFVGPATVFTNDKRPPSGGKFWAETIVKDGAVIGANCTILPGITIGEKAMIGAGAVVTKNVPAGETWIGNPAKKLIQPWKWAVVGHKGFVAPRHLKAIEEIGDEVSIIWDKEVDYKEVMQWPEWSNIDAVAICTPNYLHYPMAKAFKDKVIICEKPLCLEPLQAEKLRDNVNVVLQLRYHPGVIKKKAELENSQKDNKVKLTVKMFRDLTYWKGWKGDDAKSGGILFNLGIHYFDLLIHLFGDDYNIIESNYSTKKCTGVIGFKKALVSYEIEILNNRDGQVRKLEINGEELILSIQDNLAFEGLHTEVYKQVKLGNGIKPKEALKSIGLVSELCNRKSK